MATAYIRHEPWEMGVHKRNGVVYLDVHKLPERRQTDVDRRRYSCINSFYFLSLISCAHNIAYIVCVVHMLHAMTDGTCCIMNPAID